MALPLCRLALATTSIGNRGGAALGRLGPSLTSLDLTFNPRMSDGSFLRRLTRLIELDLSLNAWVDDEVVGHIATSMPRLQKLSLEKTEVTDVGLAALGAPDSALAGSLLHLDLSRTAVCCEPTTHAALRRLSRLRDLLLAYCPIDLWISSALPPHLERLKLSRALNFGNAAIEMLAHEALAGHAPPLRILDLGSPFITDDAIASLQELALGKPPERPGLEALTLWHTKMTRAGAEALMASTGLHLDTSMNSSDGTFLMKR